MKRKAIHLAAAGAELLRFSALMGLAETLGSLEGGAGAARLFRYAVVPQLLFPVGFFFLWLDGDRYSTYKPLLGTGKIACLAAFLPLAFFLGSYLRAEPYRAGDPVAASLLAAFVAFVDLAGLTVLSLVHGSSGRQPAVQDPAGPGPAGQGPPGQGPGEIENVEV
jgi:hypothetical protein